MNYIRLAAALVLLAIAGVGTGNAARALHTEATPDVLDPCTTAAVTPAQPGAPGTMPAGHMMTPAGRMGTMPVDVPAMTPRAAMPMAQDFDLMFLDMMIPHHESAVAMAQVALARAEHPETRELAHTIVANQQAEVDQLRSWREQWFAGAPQMAMEDGWTVMLGMMQGMPGMPATPYSGAMGPGGMMGMMHPESQMTALCEASGPFDRAFMEMMIPHHQLAVVMAQVAVQRASHDELRSMAKQMVDSQTREIEQMQAWFDAWYGGSPVAGSI
jgi:uncharacterized protein (DUF305 family)